MPGNRFPAPSFRTDLAAYRVVRYLNLINGEKNFMISTGELDTRQILIAFSGATRYALEDTLQNRIDPHRFTHIVVHGQSSLHDTMINPFRGRQYGFHYGGSRNCAEPKIIEATARMNRKLLAMTTIWYGLTTNKAFRNNYMPYRDPRAPLLGTIPRGILMFAYPCDICQANEQRLMIYLHRGAFR